MKSILRYIKLLADLVPITLSPAYSRKVTTRHWEQNTATHGDMSEDAFKKYYGNIYSIMKPDQNDLIYDYGCGSGELSQMFKEQGIDIYCWDLSSSLMSIVRQKGLKTITCDEAIKSNVCFDKLFVNNAFFYVHPKDRLSLLEVFDRILKPTGSLYIFDEPVFHKRALLGKGRLYQFITYFLPVYQPERGGFFTKKEALRKAGLAAGFTSMLELDSWSNYRSHFILSKQ